VGRIANPPAAPGCAATGKAAHSRSLPQNAGSSLPHRAGGLAIRRTLESRLWKFGCAPTPGRRIANPPQVANLPHNAVQMRQRARRNSDYCRDEY